MTGRTVVHDGVELPSGYRQSRTVDLKRDRTFAIAIQVIFIVTAASAVLIALSFRDYLGSEWSPFLSIPVILVAALAYMAAHEATHGVMLHLLTRVKPTYRLRFPFLTTGNHAYLTRQSAVIVALTPVVVWGALLAATLLVVPADYRVLVYVVLALNFAGSSGDVVETWVVARLPREAVVKDDGHLVRIFLPQTRRSGRGGLAPAE
jgi:hypothetical protein